MGLTVVGLAVVGLAVFGLFLVAWLPIAEFAVVGLVAMSAYSHHVRNNELIIKIYALFCWGANAVLQLWDLQLWDLQLLDF